ncbi:GNAT family N-acetyltransferase [Enterococcus sp. HY326]|uniref:GNAT family N-acetyltransferase n=1 Tax=Enterococcus sp. HY326 TaxID=2971265 RepID=UPI0022404DB4|nr:GNAT family N-acetyltransferase [Enterococcus sp. HY326]
MINKVAGPEDYPVIVELWEKSVLASHEFLTAADFNEIKTSLPQMLPEVDLLLWYDKSQLVGFSGTRDTALEMLFLDPNVFAQGYGRQIIDILKNEYGVQTVDVNEQNRRAKEFYLKNGFAVVSRSELDDAGRPYPLLHLSL